MEHEPRRPAFFWVTVLACAVYLVLFAFSAYATVKYFGARKYPGWSWQLSDGRWAVKVVDAAGPAAGRLEPGDRLVAVNGDDRSAVFGFYQLGALKPGETYRVDVDRRGVQRQIQLVLEERKPAPFQPIYLAYSLIFFGCGAALALLRPGESQVRLIGGTLMMVGATLLSQPLRDPALYMSGWERTCLGVIWGLGGWSYPMGYHAFSRFPTGTSPGPMWRAIQWFLYGTFLLFMWPSLMVIVFVARVGAEAPIRFFAEHRSLYLAMAGVLDFGVLHAQICLTLQVIVLAWNYRRLRDTGSRRRIRWVVAGFVAAITPLVMLMALSTADLIESATYYASAPFVSLATLCAPSSIVAAVWKEHLFDIKVLVRRGVQYLLARNALRVLLLVPFAAIALSILRNPNRTVIQLLTEGSSSLNLVSIGAIAASLRYRSRLETALDRRFFRAAYEQEQVLLQLIDEVRHQDFTAEIAHLVSARIESVLHPTAVHMFYRAEERSEMVAGHFSSRIFPGRTLPEHHVVLRIMDGSRTARDYPAGFAASLPDDERRWLEELGIRLVVPIPDRHDRLVGLLLLGERMSDEPYSATDRRLLEGIAAQIGGVCENQYLQAKVRADADVRRHVLARLEERSVSLLKECPVCGLCYESSDARCASDGAELQLTLPVERTLEGKYRLERALGRGGMGVVFEATDLRLQRQVAALVMMGWLFGDQTALRGFEREARAAARLDHPAITRVYDYGSVGSEGAYLITELISGRTWRAELQQSGSIAPARAAEWLRQLLEGLEVAHQGGIIHRDLKPENVMIVPAGQMGERLKIMDFGLAKVHEAGTGVSETLTVAGVAMGTLGYMSPEELAGTPVDARADIFAVGVMLVESLTGARPFAGRTPQEIIASLLQTDYHLPGESAEAQVLDAIIGRCLAKEPHDRCSSAAGLAVDLLPALVQYAGSAAQGPASADLPTAPHSSIRR
jgi:hypothetical protein